MFHTTLGLRIFLLSTGVMQWASCEIYKMYQLSPKIELPFVFVASRVLKYLKVIGVFTSKVGADLLSMAKLMHLTCWGLALKILMSDEVNHS